MSGQSTRDRLNIRLRHTLPRPVYQKLISRYHDARTLVGRGPGRGRPLPDFVIIGAAKAGTTSLYDWLGEHPCVAPASTKEVHYFDYGYYRGEDWYRSHFPLRSELAALSAERGARCLTG